MYACMYVYHTRKKGLESVHPATYKHVNQALETCILFTLAYKATSQYDLVTVCRSLCVIHKNEFFNVRTWPRP